MAPAAPRMQPAAGIRIATGKSHACEEHWITATTGAYHLERRLFVRAPPTVPQNYAGSPCNLRYARRESTS
jgi:hypothetical protein